MRIIKAFFEIIALLIGANCDTYKQAAVDGICDFSGQGRDITGR
jgi:hypothetical protein